MNPALLNFINQCAEREADPDDVEGMLLTNKEACNAYFDATNEMRYGMTTTFAGNVYKLQMLSTQECEEIVSRAATYDFTPNPEEEREYQIEEAVIERVDPQLYTRLLNTLLPVLNAWCLIINSTPITRVESFQIARYRPDGTPGTGWHHDRKSDFTCVISLDPRAFEGGGTGVRTSPHDWILVPPLCKGYGLVFNGKSIQHRGLPVTKGERLLLVCWASTSDID
jgi:hypothetical protein